MKNEIRLENYHTPGHVMFRVGLVGAFLLLCLYSITKICASALSLL